ncbi:MAG: hypothetical protein LBN43_02225 [Oscillospiraceae bacterium]|nr:hypothetical protein [Oscillospiraceae bacterium]
MTQTQIQRVTNKKYDIPLSEIELNFLLECMAQKIAGCVFKILSISELGDYMPLREQFERAYRQLVEIMACVDLADQILAYYVQAERRVRIFDDADKDELFLQAAETLRGMTSAPLMLEFPERIAFALWNRAGSWSGAMTLVGLEPLNEYSRNLAAMKYIINRASPYLLGEETLRKLPPETIKLLEEICNSARREMRYANQRERQRVNNAFSPIANVKKNALRYLGLLPPESSAATISVSAPRTPDSEFKRRIPSEILSKLSPESMTLIYNIYNTIVAEGRKATLDDWNALKAKQRGLDGKDIYEVFLALDLITPPEPKRKGSAPNMFRHSAWMREDWYRTYQCLANEAYDKKRSAGNA